MFSLASCLALSAALGAAAPSPLDQLLKRLERKECDAAFELVSQVQVPTPPTPASLKAAKAVGKGGEACREGDATVALAISGLAVRLAPDDVDLAVAYAEGFFAVMEFAEGAAVLDKVIAAHPPKEAPRAWMLRARRAQDDGDFETAVKLLEKLAAEPSTQKDAAPLLASAQDGLRKRKEIVLTPPPRPDSTDKPVVPPAGQKPQARHHEHGQVVVRFPGQIGLGGEVKFKAPLINGQSYFFKAVGQCERPVRELMNEYGAVIKVKPLDQKGPVFGLDFRVQIGEQPSRPLQAGVGESEESQVLFVADADEEPIRVFDSSHADKPVDCTLKDFVIVAK